MYYAILFSDLIKRSELTTVSSLIGVGVFIALLLASLGLSGLASFSAISRTKEIGIRKINGSNTWLVMLLLVKNYSKWLMTSIFIALPAAFLIGKIFLSRFNIHVPMPVWPFIAGPLLIFIIALSTVIMQSWRVANRNPAEALRYE
jgi:putative ABC transport system permease protein